LEWLESSWKGGETRRLDSFAAGLSRVDFFDFVELCKCQLAKYWKDDQRVHVVKMTIQLAKMLSSQKLNNFFPTLFFLASDVISYFGQLVYDRLVAKCPDLKVIFSFSDVSPQAKELCKNWLYKIASVRGKRSLLVRCVRIISVSSLQSWYHGSTLRQHCSSVTGFHAILVAIQLLSNA
jgi:hypothetical protein